MAEGLVTVAIFETAFEAEIAKMELEANDIESMVVGGDLVSMMLPMACGKVEIKGRSEDEEKARAVLRARKTENPPQSQEDA